MLSKRKATAAAIVVTLIGWLSWCYFRAPEPAPAAAFAVPSAKTEIVSEPAAVAPAVVSAKPSVAASLPVAVLPTPPPTALPQVAQAWAPSLDPSPLPTPTSAPRVADSGTEMIATANMYAAHASLRTAAVSDPDSAENKAILQALILKGLVRLSPPKNASGPQNLLLKKD